MPSRHRSIDLLRGVAVAVMVASHACDALLAPYWRDGLVWHLANITFGFVGPAFLMLAGVTLGFQSRESKSRESGVDRWKIARRLMGVLLLGYWLQIPVLSLSRLVVEMRPEDMRRLFDTNILHAIVFSSLALLLLVAVVRSPVVHRTIVAALALVVLVATPYVWDAEIYTALPLPIRSFLSPQPVATFPLLPYAFYLFVGFLLANLFVDRERWKSHGITMALSGLALLIGGPLLQDALAGIPPHDDFWGPGIGHTLMRSGGVVAALGLALLLARRERTEPSALAKIGRRSLGIYTLHLILLYGSPATIGLRYWFDGAFDRAFSPIPVVLAAASILVICANTLRIWESLDEYYPRMVFWLTVLWWVRFGVLFVMG